MKRYLEPPNQSREEAERELRSEDGVVASNALVGLAFYDPDWRYVQAKCLQLLEEPRHELWHIAAICLGHIATFHGTGDLDRILPALEQLKQDERYRDSAEVALDAIHHGHDAFKDERDRESLERAISGLERFLNGDFSDDVLFDVHSGIVDLIERDPWEDFVSALERLDEAPTGGPEDLLPRAREVLADLRVWRERLGRG